MTLDVRNDKDKRQRSSVQKFKTLDTLEESNLLCATSVSSKKSWGTSLIPERSLDDFGRQDQHN